MRRGRNEGLKAHLGELVDPKIGEHRGRTVKNTGDGFLGDHHRTGLQHSMRFKQYREKRAGLITIGANGSRGAWVQ
jgi:hypothetical protein